MLDQSHIEDKVFKRSSLFVPGDRPERFLKAAKSGAGIVIVDLEDAVAPSRKESARAAVKEMSDVISRVCREHSCEYFVRVNSGGSSWHDEDIREIASLPVDGVLLPKPISRGQVEQVWETSGRKPIHLLMETTHSFSEIGELARARGVQRLMLGCADLMAELGIDDDDEPLHFYRTQLLHHSALVGLEPPIDGVCLSLYDQELLAREISRAKRFGFGAKACIHPAQVERTEKGFMPSSQRLEWAKRVIESSADGRAASLGGRLIDGPIVAQARRLLASVLQEKN